MKIAMKLKTIIAVLLCIFVLGCTFAGCGETEPTSYGVSDIVAADLIGKSNKEMHAIFGEKYAVENYENDRGLDFYDSEIFVAFNLDFENAEKIPDSYYVSVVRFGDKSKEIIYGVKPGMTLQQVKAIKQFSDIKNIDEHESTTDGYALKASQESATVEYNGRTLLVTFNFSADQRRLIGGRIELIEPEEGSSAAEPTSIN